MNATKSRQEQEQDAQRQSLALRVRRIQDQKNRQSATKTYSSAPVAAVGFRHDTFRSRDDAQSTRAELARKVAESAARYTPSRAAKTDPGKRTDFITRVNVAAGRIASHDAAGKQQTMTATGRPDNTKSTKDRQDLEKQVLIQRVHTFVAAKTAPTATATKPKQAAGFLDNVTSLLAKESQAPRISSGIFIRRSPSVSPDGNIKKDTELVRSLDQSLAESEADYVRYVSMQTSAQNGKTNEAAEAQRRISDELRYVRDSIRTHIDRHQEMLREANDSLAAADLYVEETERALEEETKVTHDAEYSDGILDPLAFARERVAQARMRARVALDTLNTLSADNDTEVGKMYGDLSREARQQTIALYDGKIKEKEQVGDTGAVEVLKQIRSFIQMKGTNVLDASLSEYARVVEARHADNIAFESRFLELSTQNYLLRQRAEQVYEEHIKEANEKLAQAEQREKAVTAELAELAKRPPIYQASEMEQEGYARAVQEIETLKAKLESNNVRFETDKEKIETMQKSLKVFEDIVSTMRKETSNLAGVTVDQMVSTLNSVAQDVYNNKSVSSTAKEWAAEMRKIAIALHSAHNSVVRTKNTVEDGKNQLAKQIRELESKNKELTSDLNDLTNDLREAQKEKTLTDGEIMTMLASRTNTVEEVKKRFSLVDKSEVTKLHKELKTLQDVKGKIKLMAERLAAEKKHQIAFGDDTVRLLDYVVEGYERRDYMVRASALEGMIVTIGGELQKAKKGTLSTALGSIFDLGKNLVAGTRPQEVSAQAIENAKNTLAGYGIKNIDFDKDPGEVMTDIIKKFMTKVVTSSENSSKLENDFTKMTTDVLRELGVNAPKGKAASDHGRQMIAEIQKLRAGEREAYSLLEKQHLQTTKDLSDTVRTNQANEDSIRTLQASNNEIEALFNATFGTRIDINTDAGLKKVSDKLNTLKKLEKMKEQNGVKENAAREAAAKIRTLEVEIENLKSESRASDENLVNALLSEDNINSIKNTEEKQKAQTNRRHLLALAAKRSLTVAELQKVIQSYAMSQKQDLLSKLNVITDRNAALEQQLDSQKVRTQGLENYIANIGIKYEINPETGTLTVTETSGPLLAFIKNVQNYTIRKLSSMRTDTPDPARTILRTHKAVVESLEMIAIFEDSVNFGNKNYDGTTGQDGSLQEIRKVTFLTSVLEMISGAVAPENFGEIYAHSMHDRMLNKSSVRAKDSIATGLYKSIPNYDKLSLVEIIAWVKKNVSWNANGAVKFGKLGTFNNNTKNKSNSQVSSILLPDNSVFVGWDEIK